MSTSLPTPYLDRIPKENNAQAKEKGVTLPNAAATQSEFPDTTQRNERSRAQRR